MDNLTVGIKGCQSEKVTPENTARAVGSGDIEVYATPSMIALMEKAAYTSVQNLVPDDCATVGISVKIEHLAATPLGMTVSCESELVTVEGKKLTFEIVARDEKDVIGKGIHERVIVNKTRFIEKISCKNT